MTDTPKPPFWRSLLSASDNQSFAIGRVLAFAVVAAVLLVLIIGVPVLEAVLFALKKIDAATWFAFNQSLMAYVPAILVALGTFATAIVALTNQTEPKPPAGGHG